MKLGIIILVTRPAQIADCIERLSRQTCDHNDYEIILVISKNLSINLPETDVKIKIVPFEDLHLCQRRNAGVRRTNAELIAFLDDDTLPENDWVQNIFAVMSEQKYAGACGPITHYDPRKSLPYRLAGAATDSVFLEGFEDTSAEELKHAEFYNIPGCNCVIRRAVWDSVGGFNENMYAYMDDIEFFYIATQLGFNFVMDPGLKLAHATPPFPFDFLRKKLITRFYTGINTVLFNELHKQIPYIRFALAGIAGIMLMPFFFGHLSTIILIAGSFYLLMAFLFSLKYLKIDPLTFFSLPLVFLSTHIVNFTAFAAGLLYAVITRQKYQTVISFKNVRLQKCLN